MKRGYVLGLGAAAVIAVATLAFFFGDGASGTADATTSGSVASTQAGSVLGSGVMGDAGAASGRAPYSAAGLEARKAQLAMWAARYERAERLYASYRDATRYPHESRPISEHPDQVRPFAPITEDLKLLNDKGEPIKGVRLRTSQERVFLSGAETVRFSIAAVDDNNLPLPLIIRNAAARSIADSRTPVKQINTTVSFTDNGTGADDTAGDGSYTARLSPAAQGFDGYNGTIRMLAEVSASGQQGMVQLDVIYTSDVPATWGPVRDVVEAGSLNFYVKLQVRLAGRYVVSGRVDDANGVPFALVQFNEELAAGSRELRLQTFGALIRDKQPVFPLKLRDVDGFLLIPDQFPDRATLARLPGVVHVSGRYPLDRFSPAEWTSEERERYLTEYGKDAETARNQVQELMGK
ncbi:MAG: hypothetical protein CFE43_04860 [Burkholderiales bacterium PBB3]|nr:MAG: hypothetical protein CFE43_04860 [Burkholderiales bacterium PBB3]